MKFYSRYFKRLIDIVGSFLLLILFLPIIIPTAIAIKLNSPGPVLADVPERVGYGGGSFKMLKFRSMVINAHHLLRTDPRFKSLYEEYKKGSYKLKKDPRITSVGRFIRKHSFDEIPQLINVLMGDMSLVGPRAYYPDELENQQKKYPHTQKLVDRVLSIKPEINFDKRIAIDAKYVDKISLIEDLKIILKTPLVMISGRGAI